MLLSARRVGPSGKAYGLDMTEEMLALARRNAAEAGATNVEFLKGQIEAIPLPAETVDVVISMQARMFARRNVKQRPCDAELLRAMFERTRAERAELGELSSEPPAF